ncbi:MAG: hypothetical protein ABIW49_09565 [Knoellia sp.]
MPLSDLTDSQQAAFRARLAQAGIEPADVVALVGPDTHPGQLIASPDPEVSTIRPHLMTVEDVGKLKELAGIPDSHYTSGLMEEHHRIPDEWPGERSQLTRKEASAEELAEIHHAHLVWLYGNSSRVESYRDVINAMDYPKVIPVFAAEELVITTANSPYVITAESGHIYGVVTIYAGGSIKFEGNVDFHCQKMIKSDAPGPGAS